MNLKACSFKSTGDSGKKSRKGGENCGRCLEGHGRRNVRGDESQRGNQKKCRDVWSDGSGLENTDGKERMEADKEECERILIAAGSEARKKDIRFCRRIGEKGEDPRPVFLGLIRRQSNAMF
jgi:hypothetical protein